MQVNTIVPGILLVKDNYTISVTSKLVYQLGNYTKDNYTNWEKYGSQDFSQIWHLILGRFQQKSSTLNPSVLSHPFVRRTPHPLVKPHTKRKGSLEFDKGVIILENLNLKNETDYQGKSGIDMGSL